MSHFGRALISVKQKVIGLWAPDFQLDSEGCCHTERESHPHSPGNTPPRLGTCIPQYVFVAASDPIPIYSIACIRMLQQPRSPSCMIFTRSQSEIEPSVAIMLESDTHNISDTLTDDKLYPRDVLHEATTLAFEFSVEFDC